MSIFLFAVIGLAIDGSHLYIQKQLAQAAADSAAQAGILSLFDGTNHMGTHTAGTAFTCSASDTATACKYAQSLNKFNFSGSDTVSVDFPSAATVGISASSLSTSDSVNLLRVTVQRKVPTTLIRLLGPSFETIKARGTAAIMNVPSPVPLLITHPTKASALSMTGTTGIKICGGSWQSIEVNSSNASAFVGGGTVDLSHAGPADSGQCNTGTGADFGIWGGATTNPGSVTLGSTGSYRHSSPIQDPYASVFPNGPPVPTTVGTTKTISNGTEGCTLSTCKEYSPGLYVGGINESNNNTMEVFKPGLYYIQGGGFTLKNTTAITCPVGSCTTDPDTGDGMVIYSTGPAANPTNAGVFNINTNVTAHLRGANLSSASPPGAPTGPYYGLLFFQDRNSAAYTHNIGQGNGCFDLVGTVYITNTLAIMKANPNQYQTVAYNGNSCSATINQGEIIVSALSIVGTTNVNMGLYPMGFLKVRKVALVQ
jgi:Flp pilus assembly protein TadG